MAPLPTWRVRVRRSVEEWVEIQAPTAEQAETEAYKLPQVLSVFGQSAIHGTIVGERLPLVGVEEEL